MIPPSSLHRVALLTALALAHVPIVARAQRIEVEAAHDTAYRLDVRYYSRSGNPSAFAGTVAWRVCDPAVLALARQASVGQSRSMFVRPETAGTTCVVAALKLASLRDTLRDSLWLRVAPELVARTTPPPPPSMVTQLRLPQRQGETPIRAGDWWDLLLTPRPSGPVTWSVSPAGAAEVVQHHAPERYTATHGAGTLVVVHPVTSGDITVTASADGRETSTVLTVGGGQPPPVPTTDPVPQEPPTVPHEPAPGTVAGIPVEATLVHDGSFVEDPARGWTRAYKQFGHAFVPRGVARPDGVISQGLTAWFWPGVIDPSGTYGPGMIYTEMKSARSIVIDLEFEISANFVANPSFAQKLVEWRTDNYGQQGRILLSLYGSGCGGASPFRVAAYGRVDAEFAPNRASGRVPCGRKVRRTSVVVLNSGPGAADGYFADYLDGQLVTESTTYVWVKAGEQMMRWEQFDVVPLWGGLGGTITQGMWITFHRIQLGTSSRDLRALKPTASLPPRRGLREAA